MSSPICRLTLLPELRICEVVAGTSIQEALSRLDVEVIEPCGGEGTCGKCRVTVKGEVSPFTPNERALLEPAQLEAGIRLACQTHIQGDVEVAVPSSSRPTEMRILRGGMRRRFQIDPAVFKKQLKITPQTLSEPYARLEHLRRCGDLRADLQADLPLLRRLPALLDAADETVTAVIHDNRLLDLEPGDTTEQGYGVAFDLGTTTVVASLVELRTGHERAHTATVNRQTRFGHDVVARIHATLEHEDGLASLQQAARESLVKVLDQALEKTGIERRQIYEATLVGNATMMHLFLGISPASLGQLPYIAVVGDSITAPAADLGLPIHPAGQLYVLPNIAGFVGGDTIGAMLAAGLDEDDGRIRLLADIGTNCEIALRLGDRLLVTSTPAGPAFEGARIACGMYAAPGAIEKVHIDEEVVYKTIGNRPPQGLCGSGLVDISAELLRIGIVDATGRLLAADELDGQVSDALRQRLIERREGLAFLLAAPDPDSPIIITQRDLRELQLAKAAIRTGIELLLEYAGLEIDQLDELCIAGGFGNYIDKANAMRLGLIPELALEKLKFIGNGALVGARLALLSRSLRQRGEQLARQAEHLQLAHTPDFQMRFSEAMLFA